MTCEFMTVKLVGVLPIESCTAAIWKLKALWRFWPSMEFRA